MYALTEIKGVGRRYSNIVCKKADVDLNKRYVIHVRDLEIHVSWRNRAGELNSDELERLVTIIQNPTQFKVPTWFLNRQKDIVDGKNSQILSNAVDSKLRDDLERLKKIRAHRGLRHFWGLRVRGQHTKTTGKQNQYILYSCLTIYVFRTTRKDRWCVEEAWLKESSVFMFLPNYYYYEMPCHVTTTRKFGRYSCAIGIDAAAYIVKAMSTTWTQAHIRHPWFNPYTMKRKIRHSDSNDEEDEPSPHPTKRSRCSTLERGFAHLSLVHEHSVDSAVVEKAEWVEDVEMSMESVTALTSSETDANMVAFPSSFEGPAPDIHDVKMRKSTWYEPERDRTLLTLVAYVPCI